MPKESTQHICQHAGCECLAREADGYCCDYCKTAVGDDEQSCACGHPGCGAHIDQHPESLQVEETPFTKFFA